MAYLFSVLFQGEMTSEVSVDTSQRREVERQAFPSTPPRDAASREKYRAYKIAPLESGQILLATCMGGGRDPFGREVLLAKGCVLDASQLTGALRDLTAAWRVLENIELSEGFEGLWGRVNAPAIAPATAPDAFQIEDVPEHHGSFYSRLAEVLDGEKVDLYLGSGEPLDLIRPALVLLPLSRLRRLHLVLGGEFSEYREPAIGIAESAPAGLSHAKPGIWGTWLRLRSAAPILVDFENHEVYGATSPDGLMGLRRYQALLKEWVGWR